MDATMTDHLTESEIDDLVERLRQRPEVRLAQLEERIAKAREILGKLVGTKQGKEIMQAIAVLQGQSEEEQFQAAMKKLTEEYEQKMDKAILKALIEQAVKQMLEGE